MKTIVLAMVIVLVLAIPALAQSQGRKCTKDCSWYDGNYQTIRKSLDESIAKRSEYANYNLEMLEADLGVDIICAKKVCSGEMKKRIELNHEHIMGIICRSKLKSAKPKSEKLKSPPALVDDFSDLIKK